MRHDSTFTGTDSLELTDTAILAFYENETTREVLCGRRVKPMDEHNDPDPPPPPPPPPETIFSTKTPA